MIPTALLTAVFAAQPVDLGTADHALLGQIAVNTAATATLAQQAAATAAAEYAAQTTFRTQILFLVQVAAFAACFTAGGISWRLFVLAKNQRSFW